MFKVGDFAKMSRVSIKTLRYYDEIGLFRPTEVNASNGYRYYTIDQLPRLNRILALKDLGFSLDQIRATLNDNLTPLEIRGMLRLRRAELQEHLSEEQAQLARVEARLQLIEQEHTRAGYDIVLKPVESLFIASARAVLPLSRETMQRCGQLARLVSIQLARSGLQSDGPWHAIYHDAVSTGQDDTIDVEMGIAIAHAGQSAALLQHEQVIVRQLGGSTTTACLLHTGAYEGLWDAYIAMMEWVDISGYHGTEPYRLLYLRMPDEGSPLTEIQLPVEKNI